MKETIEKIKEICKENRTELTLMGVLILAALVLNGPELAKEAVLLYGTPQPETNQAVEIEMTEQTETETEMESETETETETEPVVITAEQLSMEFRRLRARYGSSFRIPMTIPEQEETVSVRELKDTLLLHDYQIYDPATLAEQSERSMTGLQEILEQQLAGYDGNWSVYVKNLSTDEFFAVNDRPMKSASVMKLFIMGTVYKAMEAGELERTEEIMALMNDMIIYSDNEDSNQLLYLLGDSDYAAGIAKVNAFIEEYGFSEMTIEYNGFNNSATNTSSEHFNQVSAKDCGKLLEDIYHRTWVSRKVSSEIEELMLAQNTRYKIPAGLPDGVLCGNKTGEMDSVENDAAIIYADHCDYILVVLSDGWGSKDTAISRISAVSSTVYDYLNAE